MASWEYAVVTKWESFLERDTDVQELLNDMGNDRWELVSTIPFTGRAGYLVVQFIFKRARDEDAKSGSTLWSEGNRALDG
ncbi:MAG: DUF4177 domain-containing protein [Anaerolineae bacterium]|nr:DUF4177 domain-containing protein [Anaerolineae bacterium]